MAPTYKNVPAVMATIMPSIRGVAIFDIKTPAVTPRGPEGWGGGGVDEWVSSESWSGEGGFMICGMGGEMCVCE